MSRQEAGPLPHALVQRGHRGGRGLGPCPLGVAGQWGGAGLGVPRELASWPPTGETRWEAHLGSERGDRPSGGRGGNGECEEPGGRFRGPRAVTPSSIRALGPAPGPSSTAPLAHAAEDSDPGGNRTSPTVSAHQPTEDFGLALSRHTPTSSACVAEGKVGRRAPPSPACANAGLPHGEQE